MKDYQNFILEKCTYELLLEANLIYMQDFKDILSKMRSTIAQDLLMLYSKDLDLKINFIELSDKENEVKFGTDKDKFKIVNKGLTFGRFSNLFKLAGYKDEEIYSLPNETTGKIKRIFTNQDLSDISSGYNIAEFISDDGQVSFIDIQGLEPISKKKQPISIGKLARKILKAGKINRSDKEVEDFVNEFISKISISRDKMRLFKLVSGEDIRYWYNQNKYCTKQKSTLHSSCMRYDNCSSFFDVYCKNKNCQLLILKSEYEDDKIAGRALVWTLKDGTVFMDRIYYSHDSQIKLFKEYATNLGWCYKENQDNNVLTKVIFDENTPYQEKYLMVELEESDFDYYPYMDTLRYIDVSEKFITNNKMEPHDYTLDRTDGQYDCGTCNGDGEVECEECNGSGREECNRCHGSGEINCTKCDGDGELDCDICDGAGEIECSYCDGTGQDGDEECSHCEGNGEERCPDCKNGKVECERCDGDGEMECPRCEGSGEEGCSNCGGDGRVDCPDCS